MSTLKSKVMLVILDGFGVAKDPNVSAIDQAKARGASAGTRLIRAQLLSLIHI